MRTRRIVTISLSTLILIAGISVYSQVKRPYHNGSVWSIAFIRMKPGMETAYLDYLAGPWKANQEAAKKEGLILSYKVLSVEGHTPGEWNLMLMTEFKNLATMEANEDKGDELAQKMVGDDQKQRQGYKDRLEIREVIGDRLAREVVLEPKSR
ncbi:MAG TPA: hypothetical protein VJ124_06825 [Pyrinomonadaceae bacterium]|nr:hypothetical protein [Pyrinomonadaceae bacterium]